MTRGYAHSSTLIVFALCATLAGGLSSPALADDDLRLDEAWKDAIEETEGVLTEKQQAALNDLAYQSAVARVCDAITLDPEKYAKAVNDVVTPGADNLTPEQHLERQANILVTLGTYHGLFLAEGNAHKDKFCAEAVATKADPEVTTYWK